MPLYEYRCEPCDHAFEALVRGPSDRPRCPKCGDPEHLSKLFSVPAAAHTSGSRRGAELPMCGPAPSFGGCGAPQCGGGMCGGLS